MAEYIEREAAMLQIDAADFARDNNFEGGATLLFYDDVVDRLSAIPAADVRPVVRGQNIYETVNRHCEFKCSVCGVELSSVYGGINDFGLDGGYFNFCPNCGAMMEKS